MTATAKDLGDYYLALSHVVDDHAKLERLQNAMLGVPLDEQDLAQLKSVHNEMQKREVAARALARLSASFADLAGEKAPADVSDAAEGLGEALSGIQQLPGSSYAPEVLQNAGKTLTQFALQHDERKIARSMDPTLAALAQTFAEEKPACESIYRTYIGLAQSMALELAKQHQVDPAALLEPALKPFGLTSRMPEKEIPQGLQDYVREQIQSQGKQQITAQAEASEAMEGALKELSSQLHELSTRGFLSSTKSLSLKLSDVESWTKPIL